jgi:hypothetical protein
MIQFKLSPKEEKDIEEWKEAIKTVYGSYGTFTYKFTPTGIGTVIVVYSELADIEKDFTDLDSW